MSFIRGLVHANASLFVGMLLGAVAWLTSESQAAETFQFDAGHSEVRFLWNHVGLSTQSGEFREVVGTLMIDRENLANSKVDVTIKAASLETGVAALDDDLRSKNFFEVEKFPEITFKSTAVRQSAVDRGQVTGDLTIRGVTKPVTLDVKLNFEGDHPLGPFLETYAGAYYAGFSARTEILRSDFDVGAFAPLTSDRIEIVIEAEMRRADQ